MSAPAFLFPGQASQFVGMGADLHGRYEIVRETYGEAEQILGFDLQKVSFEGPEEELKQTEVTQPAVFVHSVSAARVLLARHIRPSYVAGHSLGEYSALVVGGALTFSDGLRLVKLRGRLMQEAGERRPGTMAAIIGLKDEQVEKVCRKVSQAGLVCPANFNAPGQVVVSGDRKALQEAIREAKAGGARIAIELQVSGAFHSELMAPALEPMRRALSETPMSPMEIPLVANVTGDFVRTPHRIKALLAEQMVRPVRWVDSMRRIRSNGVKEMIEVGPGNVLAGLMRRIDPSVRVVHAGDVKSLDRLLGETGTALSKTR